MSDDFKPAISHSTAFQSAAEEAADKEMRDRWINEGGQVLPRSGHLVQTVGSEQPYKVVLTFEDGITKERPFDTLRDAEEFISRRTPRPSARDASWDRPSGFD